ncbi:Threonine efflux protein [Ascidiaceihabitans donghaensis]|uniref:Threonine efflux protein n=1 Tax=Ascidiaceihabitans donghaensis TaxID=1510460 RepID=A0A2R8BDS8_9RHOB|nr:LysE family translocator [Ascidiaceihabitans donghaensis]SPH21204.1 Threonine efflux protein [Ascidiaceihabitans donghaensis]
MTWDALLAFNTILIVALASPGAAMLFAMKTAVTSGRRAGIFTGLGLGCAATCWTGAAFLGLEAVFTLFPWAYTALKIGGALYLLYLAVTIWRSAHDTLGQAPKGHGRAFLDGLLVNFGNPKSMLFAAAVIVVIFPKDLTSTDIAFVMLNHLTLEVIFYAGFAVLLSSPPARAGYLRLKPLFDRIASLLLGGFGLKLLLGK